jgi:hypothetical protein
MTEKYTKEELEKLIWESPIERVASKMGVTGTALHKRLKRLGVVKPPPGHWMKVKYGKPVAKLETEMQKTISQKQNKTVKKTRGKSIPKAKGWRIELYLGSFRTGIQVARN